MFSVFLFFQLMEFLSNYVVCNYKIACIFFQVVKLEFLFFFLTILQQCV